MFGSAYEQITPVTSADLAATKQTDMFDLQTSVAAIRSLTLWRSREKDLFFINNRSSYPALIVLHADDTALFGSNIVAPGAFVQLFSDSAGNWYRHGGTGSSGGAASISLSAAQIIAMGTTPITLIPAPGAGRVIIVSDITMQMTRTGTAFTGGGAVEFRYTDGSGAKVTADIAAALVTTGGAGVAYASVGGIEASITPVPNAPIVIDNATAAFAAGTGTAKLNIAYRICDFN
jgi:hypothetical protein